MKPLIYILLGCLFASCASTYKPLRPDVSYYQASNSVDGLELSFKHGVLREHKNKKYAKREDKKAIRIASIKLTNTTDKPLTIGSDVFFYSGNSEAFLIDPTTLHRELKQGVAIYLLYLLLTGPDAASLVLGPGISIGNMAVAGSANQNFLRELQQFNLINKTIQPGETVFGLIGIRDIGYAPISVRFRQQITGTSN